MVAFRHEGVWWSLCEWAWEDYWLNTDELEDDFIMEGKSR